LAISRTLCELLGFRLTVVSELGVGSVFSVLLDPAATPPSSYDELVEMASSAS
jgi:signal transduction histidine kinase